MAAVTACVAARAWSLYRKVGSAPSCRRRRATERQACSYRASWGGLGFFSLLSLTKRTRGFGLSPLISLQRRNADKHDAASVKDAVKRSVKDCRKVVLTRI